MRMPDRASQARRELDRKFAAANLSPISARPRAGWIRAVRVALGMSQRALADRLGVSGPAVAKLEKAEVEGGITVAKLSEVAAALDCTLVYALVPNRTLNEIVQDRARHVAAESLGYVGATMDLEGQALDPDRLAGQLNAEAQRVIDSGRLWRQA